MATTTKTKSASKPRATKAPAAVRRVPVRRSAAPVAPAADRRNTNAPNLVIVESPAKARTVEN
ncbi:MAG: hypothetical protein ACRDG3_04135, partial [Tepidiformaceae bacterium]